MTRQNTRLDKHAYEIVYQKFRNLPSQQANTVLFTTFRILQLFYSCSVNFQWINLNLDKIIKYFIIKALFLFGHSVQMFAITYWIRQPKYTYTFLVLFHTGIAKLRWLSTFAHLRYFWGWRNLFIEGLTLIKPAYFLKPIIPWGGGLRSPSTR